MVAQIEATVDRHTKKKRLTGLKYRDDLGQERMTFFSTSWLEGGGVGTEVGDIVVIMVSNTDEAPPQEPEEDKAAREPVSDTDEAPPRETEEDKTDDKRFAAFLEENVVAAPGGRLASGHIWQRWAAMHDANPADSPIAGIAKGSLASRIRDVLSPPPTKRGRVDGRVQYFWPDLAVSDRGEQEE